MRLLLGVGSWGLIEQVPPPGITCRWVQANGLDGFDSALAFNTPLETKLLENIAELQKDKSYDYSAAPIPAKRCSLWGECPMFMLLALAF